MPTELDSSSQEEPSVEQSRQRRSASWRTGEGARGMVLQACQTELKGATLKRYETWGVSRCLCVAWNWQSRVHERLPDLVSNATVWQQTILCPHRMWSGAGSDQYQTPQCCCRTSLPLPLSHHSNDLMPPQHRQASARASYQSLT
jgi:hypothetical protein